MPKKQNVQIERFHFKEAPSTHRLYAYRPDPNQPRLMVFHGHSQPTLEQLMITSPSQVPSRRAVLEKQRRDTTNAETETNHKTKTLIIKTLTADNSQPKTTAGLQLVRLVQQLEREARREKLKKILTGPTIIKPSIAIRMGFKLVKEFKSGKKRMYQYEKYL